MIKSKGFLMLESMLALFITFLGVSTMALIVSDGRTNEQAIERKTDRIYAWHVMRKNDLREVRVHDHVYRLTGAREVYDTKEKQTYQINK
ncbi:hypothetical protein PT285_04660 [Lactobacillus sp. ESL0791]|uniref:hypothetical protein n=1 Tax=Lactobacillus sp. ESL0791 TaxID=2983234 RepID=UPI0023F70D8F|nr:hypothetical protein [Lactobacillus sp. ESL0791]MDF7638690.1 hypothetical protein [Lactobacillus sp. ESL0791]